MRKHWERFLTLAQKMKLSTYGCRQQTAEEALFRFQGRRKLIINENFPNDAFNWAINSYRTHHVSNARIFYLLGWSCFGQFLLITKRKSIQKMMQRDSEDKSESGKVYFDFHLCISNGRKVYQKLRPNDWEIIIIFLAKLKIRFFKSEFSNLQFFNMKISLYVIAKLDTFL